MQYNGTLAQFQAQSNVDQYYNSIVFITGSNGEGKGIYTRGQYFATDAAIEDAIASLNYVTGISVGDQKATVSGKGNLSFNAVDPSTVAVNLSKDGITFGLTEGFVAKVNAASEGVTKNAGDIANEIQNRENAITTLTGVVNGKASQTDLDGVSGRVKAIEDAKYGEAIAGEKTRAEAAEQGLQEAINTKVSTETYNAKMNSLDEIDEDYEDRISKLETALGISEGEAGEDASLAARMAVAEGDIDDLEAAVEKLNGGSEVAGSVDNKVAAAIAGVVASAPEDFDTLKEVADWIANDKTGAAAMQNDVASLKTAVGEGGSVDTRIEAAKTALIGDAAADYNTLGKLEDKIIAEASRADLAEKENAKNIKAISDDYLKSADKQELNQAINGKVAQSAYDTKMAELAKADTDNLAEAKGYTDEKIAGLSLVDSAVAGQYISAVHQSNGVVSVERVAIPTYTLASGSANGTVAFNGADVAVKGLGSAAYTEAGAYATAAQGAKADAAAPADTVYTKEEVNAMWAWELVNA